MRQHIAFTRKETALEVVCEHSNGLVEYSRSLYCTLMHVDVCKCLFYPKINKDILTLTFNCNYFTLTEL